MFYFYFLVPRLWKRTHFLFHHLLEPTFVELARPREGRISGLEYRVRQTKGDSELLIRLYNPAGESGKSSDSQSRPSKKVVELSVLGHFSKEL